MTHVLNWPGRPSSTLALPLKVTLGPVVDTPRALVIGIHGFGDNGENFAQLAEETGWKGVQWACPNGPTAVPFAPGGAEWFPLFSNPSADFQSSVDALAQCVLKIAEAAGVPLRRTFVLGFSQGGCMALHTAFALNQELGGVLSLSGMLVQSHRVGPLSPGLKKTPFFLAQGLTDQVVFPVSVWEIQSVLHHLEVESVALKTYNHAHEIALAELQDIARFIEDRL